MNMESGEPTNLSSFTSLPSEVMFDILKNLPAKTLLRCRCVCKDWNSIITGESFINTHLLSQPDGHLFSHFFGPRFPSSPTSDKTQLCSFFPDDSFSLVQEFKAPFPYSSELGPCRILVGSINGLLCLTDRKPFGRKLYLWNPTIRRYKTLSNTCFKRKHHQRFFHPRTNVAFGLGFRADTSDYIIIRIALFKWGTKSLKSNQLPQAEAYSLSTDSWKEVGISEDVSRRLMSIWSWPCVCVNGDLNWQAKFSDGEGRPYPSILSFDVNKEEFRQIRLPNNYINGIYPISVRIAVYRGLLGVFIYGYPLPYDRNTYVWLWTMEDYGKVDSWRRTAKVKATRRWFLKAWTSDGRIMFSDNIYGTRGRVELVDMETLQEHQFSVPYFHSVHTFKETLVSLHGANVVCE